MKVFIFVPGYYGTSLKDSARNHLVWGDPLEVLLGRKSLALPVEGLPQTHVLQLEPHDLIADVRLLGGLIKEESYDKTLSFLQNLAGKNNPVIPVAWDWRRDPIEGVKKIHQTVLRTRKRYPKASLILVSHSFGSLISAYYLRYGNRHYFQAKETWSGHQHFSKVIMCAAPFRGLMAAFRNIHRGIRVGLNTQAQSPLALSTFESSYFLLPSQNRVFLQNEKLEPVQMDIFDYRLWKKNKWGLFHPQHAYSRQTYPAIEAFTKNQLTRALKFSELIHQPLQKYPNHRSDILYLSGHGQPTMDYGIWLNRNRKENTLLYFPEDFKKSKVKLNPNVVMGDGDRTVPIWSSKLPEAYVQLGALSVDLKTSHLEALQGKRSQNLIHEFLLHDDF